MPCPELYYYFLEQNERLRIIFTQIDDLFQELGEIKRKFQLVETPNNRLSQQFETFLVFGQAINTPHHVGFF